MVAGSISARTGAEVIRSGRSLQRAGRRFRLLETAALWPVKGLMEGKRIVTVDDSIVRATTSRKINRMFRNAGAKEIHVRISSPPITHPCFFGIDTPNVGVDRLVPRGKGDSEVY
jgi:amidophosphoribosyltransferase